jgi:bifunctional DNase/RNase
MPNRFTVESLPNNDKDVLDKVLDITHLETVPAKVVKMYYSPEGPTVHLESEGSTYIHPLTEAEATAMAFVASGCSVKSHLPTIHELFNRTCQDIGMTLDKAVIEKMDGSHFYARLVYRDRHNRVITTVCSIADAITLTLINRAELFAVRSVLEKFVNLNDWPYEQDVDDIWED